LRREIRRFLYRDRHRFFDAGQIDDAFPQDRLADLAEFVILIERYIGRQGRGGQDQPNELVVEAILHGQ